MAFSLARGLTDFQLKMPLMKGNCLLKGVTVRADLSLIVPFCFNRHWAIQSTLVPHCPSFPHGAIPTPQNDSASFNDHELVRYIHNSAPINTTTSLWYIIIKLPFLAVQSYSCSQGVLFDDVRSFRDIHCAFLSTAWALFIKPFVILLCR